MQHLTESDLVRLGRGGAVEAMRRFLRDTGEGLTHAPPRVRIPVGERQLVFTIGGSETGDLAGFRLYSIGAGRPPAGRPTQMLAALRLSTGEVVATAEGAAFGAWRTAALGAVAMDVATAHLDRPLEVGVLGAGFQAGHHIPTWLATRPIAQVRIFARRFEQAQRLAEKLGAEAPCPVVAIEEADAAVEGVDAVLGVTASPRPVVSALAIPPGAYVATVGPKFGGRHEIPEGTYAMAETLFSDAVAQCAAYEQSPGPLPGGRAAEEMVALSDCVAGGAALPQGGLRLFVSEGLAGSEVALLGALLDLPT